MFDEVVVPLVDACFSGYNATVLAYGQTGSGKTYTMGSGSLAGTMEEQVGIIPRVITTIFNRMQAIRERVVGAEFRVKVQFIEIYGEVRHYACGYAGAWRGGGALPASHCSAVVTRSAVVASAPQSIRDLLDPTPDGHTLVRTRL